MTPLHIVTAADRTELLEPDWMTADARAAAEALIAEYPEIADPSSAMFVDWTTFWHRDRLDADCIDDGVLARGRSHVLRQPQDRHQPLTTTGTT